MRLHISILTTLLFLTCTLSQAQKRRSSSIGGKRNKTHRGRHHKPINYVNNIKATAFIGTSSYVGDIAGRTDALSKTRLSFALGGQYRYNSHFSFRGDLGYVRIAGDDALGPNPQRNLSFKTDIYELNLGATYDLFSFNKMYRRRKLISPYGLVGFGIFYYNPKADLEGTTYSLRQYQTEGSKYNSVSFNVQFGGGIRIKLTPQLDLGFELVYKKTFTDYLDDVSTIYPEDIATWSDPTRQQLSLRHDGATYDEAAGKKRGNPSSKDGYLLAGFRLEYTIKVTNQKYSLKKNSSRFRMHKGIRKK